MTTKNITVAVASLLLFTLTSDSLAERVLREFHGTGNTITAEFEVRAPWILDWRLNGEFEQMLAIDIMLLDGKTGRTIGQILHTKRRGNGVKLFSDSGRYKLRIDSTLAKWDIKIVQLTRTEAEEYTPRRKD